MLKKFTEELSPNSKKLIEYGFYVFEIENKGFLEEIKSKFLNYLEKEFNLKIDNISDLHNHINYEEINNLRVNFYNQINDKEEFTKEFLNLGLSHIYDAVGTELAGNKKVNFSIQLPKDESSTLGMHSDTFSGESEFQINLWVPLTNCQDSNSMFFFNPQFSQDVLNNIEKYEKTGIDTLLDSHKDQYEFIKIEYGQGLIFTPTCLHGNTINETANTRVSFNCRYKNIFSPYAEKEENEKRLGSFYKILTPKASTIIGFNNQIKY